MLIIWLGFGGILLETLLLANFLKNFGCVFFKVKHSIGHISGMVGLIDVKWKGGALVGYWVNYVTSTFDLTHDHDLWFFKVKFQNSCISGIVIWLMWNKKKANQLDIWTDCMVLPFDHTHDLDLVVSSSKFETALFEEWRGADWHWMKGMGVDHSWVWPWSMGNHGGVGGCTGQWLGWLLTLACHQHI